MEPVVVVFGYSTEASSRVVKGLVGGAACDSPAGGPDACYPWLLDNKYYSAPVRVCHVTSAGGAECPTALLEHCEAVVIVFSSQEADGLKFADRVCACYSEHCEPDVCLLVCHCCSDKTAITRHQAEQWCCSRGFELVQLQECSGGADTVTAAGACHHHHHQQQQQQQQEEEYGAENGSDVIVETRGIQRVIEALHSHTWSNLQLKNRCGKGTAPVANSSPHSPDHSTGHSTTDSQPAIVPSDSDGEPDWDDREAGFEQLLGRVAEMRAVSGQLPRQQRHLLAERFAMQLCRALRLDTDLGEQEQGEGEVSSGHGDDQTQQQPPSTTADR